MLNEENPVNSLLLKWLSCQLSEVGEELLGRYISGRSIFTSYIPLSWPERP
jgi:hypothetical protein